MCGSRSPKISLGSSTPRSLNCPRDSRHPSQRPAASANREEKRRWRPSISHSFSIRTTSLTAGPMTVKSSRSAAPTLPYSTSPTWSAMSTRAKGSPSARRCRFRELDLFQALHRGLEAAIAGDPLLGLLERYGGQHRVADEFKDMAATGPQRGRQHLEDLVQHLDDLRARGHVADPREASQIRVPQHRVEAADSSALDRAGVNARAPQPDGRGAGPHLARPQVHRPARPDARPRRELQRRHRAAGGGERRRVRALAFRASGQSHIPSEVNLVRQYNA